jgi:hypothetical protein
MSYARSTPDQSPPLSASRQKTLVMAIFLCAAFFFQLRFNVSPHVMNLFVTYTDTGGAIYEKLHFGSIGIFLLLPFAVASRPFVLRGSDIVLFRSALLFSCLMLALIVYLGAVGRSGSVGFVIDTYVVAGFACMIMLTLPHDMRRLLGDITLAFLIASAVIGFFEAIAQDRLLPYPPIRDVFRPIGLTGHPLTLGAMSATAIGFVAATRWPLWVRLLAIFTLYVGAAISTARTAFVLASLELLLLLLFTRWSKLSKRTERRAKGIVLLLLMPLCAVLFVVLLGAGFMERFRGTLFDDSFMARVTIYRVFDYFSWSEIMMGVHIDQLMFVVNEKLDLEFIESAPVVLTMLFGLPAALVFTVALFRLFSRLIRGAAGSAQLGAAVFIIASLSNNTFTEKTSVVTAIFVLLLAYRRPLLPAPSEAPTHVTEQKRPVARASGAATARRKARTAQM